MRGNYSLNRMEAESKIEKLCSSAQWSRWKFQIRVLLNAQELFEVVSGEVRKPVLRKAEGETENEARVRHAKDLQAWKKADGKAQRIIVTALGNQPMLYVMRFDNAHDMWAKLVSVYEQKNDTSVHLLQQKFFCTVMEPGDNIANHISKLEDITQQLKDFNEAIPDSMLMSKILMTLPSNYKHFHSAWESTPVADRTLANLTSRLMVEECRIGLSSISVDDGVGSAMTLKRLKSSGNRDIGNTASKDRSWSVRCFLCKQTGHMKKDCPKYKAKRSANVSTANDDCEAFISVAVFSSAEKSDERWFMDSGATDHMSNKREWFKNFREVDPIPVRVGNGEIIYANGIGDIEIRAYDGISWVKRRLEKVLFVPKIKLNLFSQGTAVDKGLEQISDMIECKFLKNGRTVAVGLRRNKMYEMLFKVATVECKVNVASSVSLKLWHEKLAHQNIKHVQEFLKSIDVKVCESADNFFCDACLYGKQTRKTFKNSATKTNAPGEIIVSDVCGPMQTQSIGGAKYFVVFKDHFSHYRTVRFMKEKSEVQKVLEEYLESVRVDTGCVVKVFRSDNGLEYANSEVESILSKRGIRHHRSVPYTPEQNGSAEREMRTLVEAGRTMIHAAGLSLSLWAEAVNTAVYVLNRTGTSSIVGKTPYELWFGKGVSSYDNFHVFGTHVFTHIPKEKRRKWDVKSQEGKFVGYGENCKAFRVWYPETNKVSVSRDLVFKTQSDFVTTRKSDSDDEHESEVQKKNTQPTTTPTQTQSDKQVESESDSNTSYESVEMDGASPSSGRVLRDRSKMRQPVYLEEDSFKANVCTTENDEPLCYQDAIKSKSSALWKNAMQEEMDSLIKNNTWTMVEKPKDRKVIQNRWVFRVKSKPNGEVDRYKARLVVRGFSQVYGVDYLETFSPVVKYSSIRMILAVAASEKLYLRQFDIKTAFLNGDLSEEIFMNQPDGFEDSTGRVCRLNRSLYGLKQASRCWNKKFSSFLKTFKLVQSESDSCVFINSEKSSKIILAIYIDDGLVAAANKEDIELLLNYLKKEFEITSGPLDCFLGLEIKRFADGAIHVNQSGYARRILAKFRMEECNPLSIPADPHHSMSADDHPAGSSTTKMKFPYREAVGSLMYLATATRPDIAFAISNASRYLEKPEPNHWGAVKRIFRYVQGTSEIGIFFKSVNLIKLCAYSDADYAGDLETRRSTTGYVFHVGSGAVSWCSQRQSVVALSTTESEYIAACQSLKELIWLNRLLREISPSSTSVPKLNIDNQSAIKLIRNPEFHKRTKHIDVKFHFIREKYEDKIFEPCYVGTDDQLADILTKPLSKDKFERFRSLIGLVLKK